MSKKKIPKPGICIDILQYAKEAEHISLDDLIRKVSEHNTTDEIDYIRSSILVYMSSNVLKMDDNANITFVGK